MLFFKKAALLGAIFGSLAFLSTSSAAGVSFYVDSARTANGNGSASSPWKLLSDIDWTVISNNLNSADVRLYMSSRASWSPPNQAFTPGASGTASHRFYVIGDEFWNANATGTAVWNAETGNGRARLDGGANFALPEGVRYFTLKGIYIYHPIWSCIVMGDKLRTNVYEIAVYNCVGDSPINSHGVAGDYLSTGCSNILVSGCTFSNTIGEAIYMCPFDDLTGNVRGIILESNLFVNCGLGGQGEMDIKPPCTGAIIRYNTHLRTASGLGGANCGVVIGADNCQVYGNIIHNCQTEVGGGWGCGIFVNSDGDGAGTGKAVHSCLIYNNLIYANMQAGIKMTAGTSTIGADVSGIQIWNNTIWGNSVSGIDIEASNGRSITIAALKNNIIGGNANYDINLSGTVALSACDYNLYYSAAGNSWSVNNSGRTWAQWHALGFDSNGLSSSPQFVDAAHFNFDLQTNSPALKLGVPSSVFNTDLRQNRRPASAWDLGALQAVPAAPQNLVIIQ
jgi:hypothetical protein